MRKSPSLLFPFLLCLLGFALPVLMVQGTIAPSFLLCFIAYGASVSGSFSGFLVLHSKLEVRQRAQPRPATPVIPAGKRWTSPAVSTRALTTRNGR